MNQVLLRGPRPLLAEGDVVFHRPDLVAVPLDAQARGLLMQASATFWSTGRASSRTSAESKSKKIASPSLRLGVSTGAGGGTAFAGPADATTRGGAGLGAGDWLICCLCEQLTDATRDAIVATTGMNHGAWVPPLDRSRSNCGAAAVSVADGATFGDFERVPAFDCRWRHENERRRPERSVSLRWTPSTRCRHVDCSSPGTPIS